MKRDQIISICFLALLIFVIYQTFLIFAPFFGAIFWSALLAFGFYPIYSRLKKILPFFKETWVALLMTGIIFLLVVPPCIVIIANITAQAIELYQLVISFIREGHLENFIDQIRELSITEKIKANIVQWEPLKENATQWILNASKSITNFSLTQAGVITKNLFLVTVNSILTFFFIFIFLKDGGKIYSFIYQVTPLEEGNKSLIYTQINETFSAVIRGQILTCLAQAGASGIIFWILGLPLPIFFAMATFITSLIPLVGAAGIWVPLVIYLLIQQLYVKAIILLLFGVLVISLIDNILKPAIIGEKTKLPYFLLFFGILGGIKLYGILGVFLAPVILSLFFSSIKIFQERFTN